jgi:hypothetical protein
LFAVSSWGKCLRIKFAANMVACLVLAFSSSLATAQQTTPSNDEPSTQTAPEQDSTHPPASTPASPQTPSGQTPSAQTPVQDQTTPQTQTDKDKDKSKDNPGQTPDPKSNTSGTSNDRLFYALPNFLTLQKGRKLPPLTTKQKFAVVARGTFDPVNVPWWGTIAAIDQAADSEPGYGQGWLSYAKRYGSTAGDSITENFMVGAIYPSILRQDPRFYYSEDGGPFKRMMYAVTRIVVTRGDSGHAQFNFSEVLGAATAAAITTNAYHPKGTYISTPSNPHEYIASERTLGNTADTWATQLGLDTITLVIKEFWPDLHKRVAKKREAAAAAKAATAN